MVYGSEAVLPTDLDYGAPKIRAYDEQGAEASRQDAMDQLDEARDIALLRSAKYQQALRRYHSRRVRGRAYNVGDLVLRLVQSNKHCHKALFAMGETIRHHRSALTRHLQAQDHRWQGLRQHMEHRAATSFLPLAYACTHES